HWLTFFRLCTRTPNSTLFPYTTLFRSFSPDHPDKGMEQTGAVMIENKTGRILAMIEGRDFYTEQLNHATRMTRQPGSAMKLFALDRKSTRLNSSHVKISYAVCCWKKQH